MKALPTTQHKRDILAHWSLTVPIFMVVAALSLRQIDLYLPTHDEFFSMFNSGWLVNGPYSPIEVIQSIQTYSPNHSPGYFLLLSAWGNLTTFDAAAGRVLTIFCGLLSLAIAYLVVSDFVSPVAGLFAIVILSSNAFYNFYLPHVRMYPLMLFLAGVVLWLYLRILYQVKSPRKADYAALLAAVYALANTHVFSATFFAMLSIYHLIFVQKNSVWWKVSAMAVGAFTLFLPFVEVLITKGIQTSIAHWSSYAATGRQAIRTWLVLVSNGQPALLLLSFFGVVVGYWKKKLVPRPFLLLIAIYILILFVVAEFTPFVAANGMRHQLSSWFALGLFVCSGLYALYSMHKILATLLLLWVVAGGYFQITANWRSFLASRTDIFRDPALHLISRELSRSEAQIPVIGYRLPQVRIDAKVHIGYSRQEHYIDRFNVDLQLTDNMADLNDVIRNGALSVPEFWIVHQDNRITEDEATQLREAVTAYQYAICETLEFGADTVMERYRWQTLGCETRLEPVHHRHALFNYTFYAARVDSVGSRVYFVDEWLAHNEESLDKYKMSHQLISKSRENVAQLDLPLVREGKPRQFSIDIKDVPAGTYQLVAITYDSATDERVEWNGNEESETYMLPLASVVVQPHG